MHRGKPSVNDVISQTEKCKVYYANYRGALVQDEEFYELEFANRLGIPKQYQNEAVVLTTARDMVDAFVDHIDLANARVFVNKKGIYDISDKVAENERRFYLGLLHETNIASSISPWRVGGKHYANHGLSVMKTIWEADNWLDKPAKLDDESDEHYADRIAEWAEDHPPSLPILIQAINPHNVMLDPSYGGKLYTIEYHQRAVFDMEKMYPRWKNINHKSITETVDYVSYWDNEFRCDLVDGQAVLKGGVVKHNYGFTPYTPIESGLGNLGIDALPEQRYVGINRYAQDLYVSESRNYSVADVILKRDAWRGGFVQGPGAEGLTNIKQEYGTYTPVEEGTVFTDWDVSKAPDMVAAHMIRTADMIAGHAAPRSVRGLSETGVRSGADRRLVISEAAAKFQYSKEAFRHGAEQVLIKCAKLYKNVVPADARLSALATSGEGFDEIIKRDLMREPFTCYVEFAPISEEDEYRRQDALNKLWAGGNGLVTEQWAWRQMSSIDPVAMEREKRKNQLRQSPSYLATLDQAVGMMAQQAFGLQPQIPQEVAGDTQGAPEGSQRQLVPPIPERNALGSLDNLIANIPQLPTSGIQGRQGLGGGGNRG